MVNDPKEQHYLSLDVPFWTIAFLRVKERKFTSNLSPGKLPLINYVYIFALLIEKS